MLEIVKASAGSGKTYELTGQYIQMLFKESVYTYSNYKTILAVTFTNKATSEMKERILKELSILSTDPLKSNYLDALRKMPLVLKNGGSDPVGFIKEHSSKLLISILNDYSYFNVSTIDRFLQRVMRSFAREIGQYSSYNVELDHSDVLSYAVDMLMSSVDSDPKLLEWLLKLSKSQMEDGKNWDVTSTLLSLSNELFKEKFKLLKNKIGGNCLRKMRYRKCLPIWIKLFPISGRGM
jgi:ATP-dependent exoDNAse (exonuclease V) beta subunit